MKAPRPVVAVAGARRARGLRRARHQTRAGRRRAARCAWPRAHRAAARLHRQRLAPAHPHRRRPAARRRGPQGPAHRRRALARLSAGGRESRRRRRRARPALCPARDLARIALRPLPRELPPDFEHGLLYLPRPYVVPGGRFNEMYGWDSYFIVVGLLRDERAALARSVVDDFLYEVRHYGGVLNANRTYYLTRSQPPLLAEMVVALYHATGDRAWLAGARDALVAVYEHWLAPPHLIPSIGLSRYFDHGEGPAPEVVAGERDAAGDNHYDRVRAWFRAHPERRGRLLQRRIGRADAALLQGRSLDARIGVRSHRPLRPVRRRRHPLRPGLPEHPPLPDGARPGRDRPGAGQGREGLAGAGRGAQGADRNAAVGRRRRPLLRLRLRERPPQPLPVRDDVLAAVGRRRVTDARAPRARQPAAVRARRAGSSPARR